MLIIKNKLLKTSWRKKVSIGFNPWNLIRSMKSADQWGETINANINGAGRNAFKSSEVMFGGGLTNVLKSYANNQAGIQVAETQLDIGYSRVKWKQGEIVKTTEQETNFAINGRGFFIVAEPKKTNWTANPLYFGGEDNAGASVQQGFLTKDGQLHFAIVTDASNNIIGGEPILVNNEGLVVLADYGTSSDNWMAPVTKSQFQLGVRPSIVEPTNETVDASAPANILDYNDLQFSKYGSTIYQAPTATQYKTIINGSYGLSDKRSSMDFNDYQSQLIEKALEASNVNLDEEIVGLSASKSFYEALTKNFLVYLDNTDAALRLFR